jgi:predicted ABC-class ATPase
VKALYQKIRAFDGKNYGLYRSLEGKSWDFGDFSLDFLHVQGDPFAPASRILVTAPLKVLGFDSQWSGTFERKLAISDFLLRRLAKCVKEKYPDKNGAIEMDEPGPEVLVRNALWVDNGELRACLQVRLPGEGRKIQAELAAEILTMVLPDLLSASLYCTPQILQGLEQHNAVLERRRLILEELPKRGLVAFVPDGAVLPRASGLSQDPLQGAVPFVAPDELAVTLDVGGESIRGMGIPKGITVITGGAYHGKSTLLQALVRSVYPHVPGDGREGIVIDESAMRVGVEDGRYVRETDISPMVRDLPGGVSTKSFSTSGASGSTSEAANLMESMEMGCRTFLIDEDSSAVNFLIRDRRVRDLLGDDREPLIPLTDRIRQFAEGGYSFILVAGACGDFLSLADNIVVMAEYRAEWVKASSVTLEARVPEPAEGADRVQGLQSAAPTRFFLNYTKVLQPKVRPASAVERQVKVKLNGDTALQVGQLIADVSRAGLLVDRQQRVGAGYLLLNLLQNAEDVPVCELAEKLCEKIRNVGFRNLPQGMSRYMSLPRAVDLAAVLFRLH